MFFGDVLLIRMGVEAREKSSRHGAKEPAGLSMLSRPNAAIGQERTSERVGSAHASLVTAAAFHKIFNEDGA